MSELLYNNKIYKIIKKIKNEEVLSFIDLKIFTEEYIKLKNLNHYTNEIISSTYPAYNLINKNIKLNADINEYWVFCVLDDYEFEKINYVGDIVHKPIIDINFYNLLFLFSTIHELWHAEQKKILVEDYNNKDNEYLKNLLTSQINNNYSFDHAKAFHEFDANINAINKLSDIQNIINFNNIESFNMYLAYKILYAYGNDDNQILSSPIENNQKQTRIAWNNLYNNVEIEIYKKMKPCYDFLNNTEKEIIINSILNGYYSDNINLLKPIYKGEEQTQNIKKLLKF